MKNILFLFLLCAVVLVSCEKENLTTNDELSVDDPKSNLINNIDERSAVNSTVAIYEDPDGPPATYIAVEGAVSTLKRKSSGITISFKTNGLIPGNAYTLWFVIFGENPGPPVLVTYAAGHVVGASGKGNFSAHLNVGDVFDNPMTGEVHLALRTHGPVQPEMMPDQIQDIDGGCNLPDIGYPSGPALYGDSDQVGYCANIQVAMHPRND